MSSDITVSVILVCFVGMVCAIPNQHSSPGDGSSGRPSDADLHHGRALALAARHFAQQQVEWDEIKSSRPDAPSSNQDLISQIVGNNRVKEAVERAALSTILKIDSPSINPTKAERDMAAEESASKVFRTAIFAGEESEQKKLSMEELRAAFEGAAEAEANRIENDLDGPSQFHERFLDLSVNTAKQSVADAKSEAMKELHGEIIEPLAEIYQNIIPRVEEEASSACLQASIWLAEGGESKNEIKVETDQIARRIFSRGLDAAKKSTENGDSDHEASQAAIEAAISEANRIISDFRNSDNDSDEELDDHLLL